MNYKTLFSIIFLLFLINCDQSVIKQSKKTIEIEKKYQNSGFALVYNNKIDNIKKLDTRSLSIYHKYLKKNSVVKVTNPNNGKYLIANVKSNKVKFSNF